MSSAPRLSIVLATCNRRDILLHTLDQLAELTVGAAQAEVLVVDNASRDGAADAVRARGDATLIPAGRNRGSCAKALALPHARGDFILMLDDDSYPRPGSLERMFEHFERSPSLGAAGFTVHLPDGSEECSALPHVFVGCGVGLRAAALRAAGGLDLSFFMQAEEYDLSFRLLRAGYGVEIFGDLSVDHLKSPQARRSERTTYYDIRNNLRVVARYLPPRYATVYRRDWIERYAWLAQATGHERAYRRGLAAGRRAALLDRWFSRGGRLSPASLEQVFGWRRVQEQMTRLRARGAQRIVLADLGKNVYAFWRGARAAGVAVAAIADDRFARRSRRYRDVPVLTVENALRMNVDAIVISNMSYVHAAVREAALRMRTRLPVCNWFPPPVGTGGPVSNLSFLPEGVLAS